MKNITISKCKDCPFHIHDDETKKERWGRHWCEKLNQEVQSNHIPNTCPLPDSITDIETTCQEELQKQIHTAITLGLGKLSDSYLNGFKAGIYAIIKRYNLFVGY